MNFFRRQVDFYLKLNFKINNIILKRVSLAKISKIIDKYKNDKKIAKKNFDIFSEYIISRSNSFENNEELETLIKMLL
jgi:predicted solute-binding protein